MKNILAIDAATEVCSVALSNNGELTEMHCNEPRSHAKKLLPMVDKLMGDANFSLNNLDSIVLTNGPGSFTGIRICLGVAQGLSYGANVPVLTFSTLELLASQVEVEIEIPIVVALDARMGELYWAVYQNHRDGYLDELVKPCVTKPEAFEQTIRTLKTPFSGVGHGWLLVSETSLNNEMTIDSELKPQASRLIALLQNKIRHKKTVQPIEPGDVIEPLYLRNEISWQKRKRIRDI